MRRTGFEGPERVRRDKRALDSKENEVEMPVLKDTEASLDIGCEKYAAPERCLQVSMHRSNIFWIMVWRVCVPQNWRLSVGAGHVVSKPVVSPVHLDKENIMINLD
ncbi:hypothetical protein TNCV_165041 [Trichonephila clavipes]|nr:hypothetical protein TNCV_165041 [Trichonephila clavipes]